MIRYRRRSDVFGDVVEFISRDELVGIGECGSFGFVCVYCCDDYV